MTPDDLRRIAQNPDLIDGVHNYCDRWCERCPFTRRCAVYLAEEVAGMTAHIDDPEAEPPDLEASLASMSEMFAATRQMMEEDAREEGEDWEEIVAEANLAPPRRRRKPPKFVKQTRAYGMAGMKWLSKQRKAFEARGEELAAHYAAGLPGADPHDSLRAIEDALEVIQWHLLQIYVKFTRALGDEGDPLDGPDARDSQGSAKVALLALDATIAAWETLHREIPAVEKDVLRFLSKLTSIRRDADAFFPTARAFARPGFDDPKYADLVHQFRPEPKKRP